MPNMPNVLNNINKFLPIINLGVSSTALIFQTQFLYPSQNNLDQKFNKLNEKFDNFIK
jgi:hypothetical protein